MTVFNSGPDGESQDNLNGHGSYTAGTLVAIDDEVGVVGVAAGPTAVAIKVLDRRGSGSYSGVIAGINYVAAKGETGDVAKMSLAATYLKTLNDAVIGASENVKFAVAAGNDGPDAENHSPAGANGGHI